MVELPGILVEVAPAANRRVGRDGLPALMPDAARAEQAVELGRVTGRRVGVLEAIAHAHAVETALGMPLDRLWRLHSQHIEDGRDEVDGMVILFADLALRLDT